MDDGELANRPLNGQIQACSAELNPITAIYVATVKRVVPSAAVPRTHPLFSINAEKQTAWI